MRSGEHQDSELTGRKELVGPFLNILEGAVEAGRDDSRLVETAQKVDDDLARAVIINNLELTDVTVLLHQAQEGNDDLGSRADHHLALSTALSVGDGTKGVGKGINKNHFEIFESYSHK
jgi:hypothetical protein